MAKENCAPKDLRAEGIARRICALASVTATSLSSASHVWSFHACISFLCLPIERLNGLNAPSATRHSRRSRVPEVATVFASLGEKETRAAGWPSFTVASTFPLSQSQSTRV